MTWDRTSPGQSFCPGIEQLQGSHSVLEYNDSRGVILSWDRTTPGGHSVLGYKDSRGVILSLDTTTPGESL